MTKTNAWNREAARLALAMLYDVDPAEIEDAELEVDHYPVSIDGRQLTRQQRRRIYRETGVELPR